MLKHTGQLWGLPMLVILFTVLAWSCADPVISVPSGDSGISVAVNGGDISVNKGGTATFTATVTGPGNPAETVTWSIVGDHHEETTISAATGDLSVSAAESAASFRVRATSIADTGKYGEVTVTVTTDAPATVSAVSIKGGVTSA
jgi:hypothetical protein